MKKTLAAVLAAAMALSTASVAMAKDQLDGESVLETYSTIGERTDIKKGKEYKYILSAEVLDTTKADISPTDLGKLVKNGTASVTVQVTEGLSRMASKPTTSIEYIVTAEEVDDVYKWNVGAVEIKVGDKTVVTNNAKINGIPVDAGGNFNLTQASVTEAVYPGDSRYDALYATVIGSTHVSVDKKSSSVSTKQPVVQIKFKVADDWKTSEDNIGMKFKITFKKDWKDAAGTVLYGKGDTVMTDEVLYKAKYDPMNDKGTDMELTLEECKNREVLMNKDSELYDKIGTDEFRLYFQDAAVFTGKMSPTQKVLNMYYTVDDISDISDLYPEIDFEFIDFKGRPTFVNSGEMTFNAIGGKDTVVYTYDGDSLTPFTSNASYNSTYNTVNVKGIKKLGTFVIASTALEILDDEDNEPVSSAPVVEEPSSSEPTVDVEKNPSTGAC